MIPEGATIMIGGFMGCGNTHGILDALARSGKRGFTVICNDGAMLQGPDGSECYGVAKLIRNRQIKRLIATHVGLNPEVAQQMNEGTLQVDLRRPDSARLWRIRNSFIPSWMWMENPTC